MQTQIQNYPDISFIGGETLESAMKKARTWYEEHWNELTGEDIVLHDTDEESILLDAISYIFYNAAQYVDNAGKMNTLKYAYDEFLDEFSARFGMTRLEAQPAHVTMKFTLTEAQASDYTVPEGTRVSGSNLEDIYFATNDDTVIPAGDTEITIPCTCTTAGTDGNNIAIGELDELVDTLPYIDEVVNVTISDGGTDEEDDDTFAERIFLAPSTFSTAGTVDSYKYHTKSASSMVDDVNVSSPDPSYVTITITSKTGMPSQELTNIVTAYLNESVRKDITDRITVTGPSPKTFNLTMTYYIGYENQKYEETIKEKVEAAVEEYITWQTTKIGRNINPSKLQQMVMDAGANRVTVTAPEDVVVSDSELAVLGTKSVTYGGLENE